MSSFAAQDPRLDRRLRFDQALVELVRIVMADGWTPDKAAKELNSSVRNDRRVLRLLRARVAKTMLERPTRMGERASVTLDRALPSGEPASLMGPTRRAPAPEARR